MAPNLLNQHFNPAAANQIWAGDITYLRTEAGWMYLAVVMDLYSRRIVGWHCYKRMSANLVCHALRQAIDLRQPRRGLIFHSSQGSQYRRQAYRRLLVSQGIRFSMGGVGGRCGTQLAKLCIKM